MFHTPPTNPSHESWSSATALKNSYFTYEPEQELVKVAADDTTQPQDPTPTTLPPPLLRELDNFSKFLKEPRFTKPLSMYDISDLFQKFYAEFNEKNTRFVKTGAIDLKMDKRRRSRGGSASAIPLLEPTEISQKKIQDRLNAAKIHNYNMLIEKSACDKFYDAILVPKTALPTDVAEVQINTALNKKLGVLFKLNVSLTNLDIDLPVEEEFFICKLDEAVIPHFVEMTAERSPIGKLKNLYKVHETIGEVVKSILDDCDDKTFHMNTDLYLPVLIFAIMNLPELHKINLYQQLQFIKRFKNDVFFETKTDEDATNSDERGKLLYVLTNLEASLMYLGSCTAENLNLDITQDVLNDLDPEAVLLNEERKMERHSEILELLAKPISFEAASVPVTPATAATRSRRSSRPSRQSSVSEGEQSHSRFSLGTDFTLYNADQGLRSISTAVDSSVRSILGRFTSGDIPLWTNTNQESSEISEATKLQIEENLRSLNIAEEGIKETEQRITPTSSISTTSSGGTHQSHTSRPPPIATLPERSELVSSPISPIGERFNAFNKITNSVNGVMKNLKPLSASSSTTSLNNHLEQPSLFDTLSPNRQKSRSRTASFISGSIFGASSGTTASNSSVPTLNSIPRAGLFGNIETAIEKTVKTRSRGNSMLSDPGREVRASDADSASVSTGEMSSAIAKLEPELSKLSRFDGKEFNELSVAELHEMFDNYRFIMNHL